jgi:phytoene/squalene synthetase
MPRSTPAGFRKTSYELTLAAKFALEDLTRTLDRDGYEGLGETTVVEALIVTAKRDGVDRTVLDRVIKSRRAALDRADKAHRTT